MSQENVEIVRERREILSDAQERRATDAAVRAGIRVDRAACSIRRHIRPRGGAERVSWRMGTPGGRLEESEQLIDVGEQVLGVRPSLAGTGKRRGGPSTGAVIWPFATGQSRTVETYPRPRRGPQSRGAGGVGDVAGERGVRGRSSSRSWRHGQAGVARRAPRVDRASRVTRTSNGSRTPNAPMGASTAGTRGYESPGSDGLSSGTSARASSSSSSTAATTCLSSLTSAAREGRAG